MGISYSAGDTCARLWLRYCCIRYVHYPIIEKVENDHPPKIVSRKVKYSRFSHTRSLSSSCASEAHFMEESGIIDISGHNFNRAVLADRSAGHELRKLLG